MNTQSITCPNCRTEFALTEAVAHSLREELKREYDAKLKLQERALGDRERKLMEEQKAVEQARATVSGQIERRLAEEKTKLLTQAREQIQSQMGVQLQDLQSQLKEKAARLADAEKAELALRKEKRDLQEQREALELDVARKLDQERAKIRAQTAEQVTEEQRLKGAEREKLIADLQKQIEALKQKAEQGSQQLQGEVLELDLEALLKQEFPHDEILPVAKGTRGADVLQRVRTSSGQCCGSILWETKRTRNWSDGWIAKLKEDQRSQAAEVAVLLTLAMPGEIKAFGNLNGIWVTDCACAIGLATALRYGIISTAQAQCAQDGKQTKMEVLYQYFAGNEFRQRVETMVDAFVSMKNDLDDEKRALQRLWAKREKQIEQVLTCTAMMYGSLQGIVGESALPELHSLALPAAPPAGETVLRLGI